MYVVRVVRKRRTYSKKENVLINYIHTFLETFIFHFIKQEWENTNMIMCTITDIELSIQLPVWGNLL